MARSVSGTASGAAKADHGLRLRHRLLAPFFLSSFPEASLVGVDVSRKSLEVARQTIGRDDVRFLLFEQYQPRAEIDLAFANGVFHHIAPSQRPAAVQYIRRSVRR